MQRNRYTLSCICSSDLLQSIGLRAGASLESKDYVENKTQFHLHHLTTEQRHPNTMSLSRLECPKEALRAVLSVDHDITDKLDKIASDKKSMDVIYSLANSVTQLLVKAYGGER